VQYNGQAYAAWGLGPRPLYAYRLSAGRWFTAADGGATGIPPVILGPVVADTSGARVGQVITLDMAAGPVKARVIGIDTGQNNSGSIVYFPLTALERLNGAPGTANTLWVTTASPAHAAVDQAAARRCRFSLCANIASAPSSMPSPLLWPRALCWRCCCQSNCSTVL
jgi:hypothetical protein